VNYEERNFNFGDEVMKNNFPLYGHVALNTVTASNPSKGEELMNPTVPIAQIGGSEGRAGDFDRDFNPLQDYTRERWLGIAAARERGKALPLVSLAQVGDIYFVKDGHHRISVARALGQKAIEAKVVEWQVEGSLPWETSTCAPGCEPVGQPKGVERAFSKLRREGARVQDRVLLSARGLMAAVRMALGSPAAARAGVDRV
jgi:hypothetical protein